MITVRCIIVLCLLLVSTALWAQPDAQSRYTPSGPAPEDGYDSYQEALQGVDAVVIPGVPSYAWHLGCAPTAAGMVIGFWDGQGCDRLIPGDATTQTEDVEWAIASMNGPLFDHFSDYVVPIDDPSTGILPDRSEPPVGDEHASNCLADFMKTSFSSEQNYFGWTWFSDVSDGVSDYVAYINGSDYFLDGYKVKTRSLSPVTFSWEAYVEEINAGRPVILLVDTTGDGATDHFVTAIGWRDSKGYNEYACFDTWAPVDRIRWSRFRMLAPASPWSIFGAVFVDISPIKGSGPTVKGLSTRSLAPNYPNPFNPCTKINFAIDRPQQVRVAVFDLTGNLVKVLADRSFAAGSHSVDWLGQNAGGRAMPSGTYVVRLRNADGEETQKITLLR